MCRVFQKTAKLFMAKWNLQWKVSIETGPEDQRFKKAKQK
jgi:hypothetical protein